MPGSANHCSNRPMQLNTPSAPATARRTESGSATSPRASSTPAGSSSRAFATSRTNATTSSPRSASRLATALPILPVAPVTRNLIGAAAYSLHTLARVTRFRDPPDPLFQRLNASIGFDRRLARYDVEQSRAHARALRAAGVLDDEELARMEEGLATVGDELESGSFATVTGDEDIHMAIERRLTEIVGPLGGKLHTGRSRNDQVATDVALYVREHAALARGLAGSLMGRLLELAERDADWPMPGYSHLQRAQCGYLGHHLRAYFWMLQRDARRFSQVREAAGELPLGSGALAGVNWDLDREAVARELGFDSVSPNSIDAVSSRDFVLDYLSAASICAMHLSRLGGEIVLWASDEFSFCEVAEDFSSGSSIMPQKMNPDAAELLRAKAPRLAAGFLTLAGVMHGLPLAYSKDLQEDKEPLFDAVDTLELCLEAAERMLGGLSFDRERLAEAAADELLAATDIADLL